MGKRSAVIGSILEDDELSLLTHIAALGAGLASGLLLGLYLAGAL